MGGSFAVRAINYADFCAVRGNHVETEIVLKEGSVVHNQLPSSSSPTLCLFSLVQK